MHIENEVIRLMKRVLAKKVSGAARSWWRPIFHCQPRSRRAPELLLLVEENDGRPEIGRMRACVSIVLLAVPLSLSLSARGAVAAFPSLAASPRESLPSAAQAGRLAAHPAK